MSTNNPSFEPVDERLYTVSDISKILKISSRKAYDLCNSTRNFKVVRVGRCLRVKKESFDDWFNSL